MTVALTAAAVLTPVLVVAVVVVCLLWRAAALEVIRLAVQVADMEVLARHQGGRIDGYRAELDALSIAPPAAVAALTPDAPSLLADEIEQWLHARPARPANDTEDPR